MSTIVQIQVNVDDAKALSALTNIENIGKRLSSTPIEIKIDSGDGQKVARSVISLAKQRTELAKASAKQAAAEAKLQTAQEKTKQTANNLAAQQEKTAQSANRLAAKQIKAASSTSKMGTEAQKTSTLTDLLGDSLGRIIAKQAAWQLIGNGISAVKNAFADALSTMKDVDSELATVRKVTGMTKDEMNALGESAYSTASKYGVSANEYLENVSTFARAGYKEAAQGLGELAIKTQLVGDTDQETAAQFLLSADAAWKYNGNVQKLSLALDEANTIDNNYATSIQKIAEGLPIVANVASMAGMSMEETMAMIGTITATTQESGTKAATAARALILNILGDTTTEIADGVTATEETVQSLSGILQKYAPDVVEAAQATGELINPMEAIAALSEAAKDGLLTEADLMTLVSDLGGKLRTNQLLALLENFDTYKDMLEDMSTAAGSAQAELAVMLDTWESKANILKNTWTEFVVHLVDTEDIKTGFDIVIGLVEVLDSDFGHLAINAAAAATAATLLSKAFASIKGSALISTLQGMTKSTADLKAGWSLLTKELQKNSFAITVAAITTLISAVNSAVDATERGYDKLIDRGSEAASEAENVAALYKEYLAAADAVDGTAAADDRLTQASKALADALGAEKGEADDLADSYKNLTEEKLNSLLTDAEKSVQAAKEKLTDPALNMGGIFGKMPTGLLAALGGNTFDGAITTAEQYVEAYNRLLDIQSEMLKNGDRAVKINGKTFRYDQIEKALGVLKPRVDDYNNALENQQDILDILNGKNDEAAETTTDTADALDSVAESADAATQAVERYNNALSSLTDREEAANDIQSKFKQALKDFQDGKLGSIELGKFLDTYIPDDVKRELNYNIQDMMEWAMSGNVGRILNSDDMFGEFYDVIKENVDSGALDGIVTMDDQGVIRAISSYKELAEALGMTEAQAEALGHGLSNYMDGVFYTGEEAKQVVSDVGKILDTSLTDGETSLKNYIEAVKEVTGANTSTELSGVFAGLMQAGAIDWQELLGVGTIEEAMSIINDALAGLESGQDGAGEVKVNVSGAEEAQRKLADTEKAAKEAGKDVETKVTAPGADEANAELENMAENEKSIPGQKNVTINVKGNAKTVLGEIKTLLDNIKNKTVTVTVRKAGYGSGYHDGYTDDDPTGGNPSFTAAQGVRNFAGGKVIVNDGKPVAGSSAELIIDKGQAYIANEGQVAAVELSPGATVFTAEETHRILSNTRKQFLDTFAGGTGLVRPSKNNGGVYGGNYSGGTGAGGSGSSSRSGDDPLKQEIQEKLDNLDKQITLARNRNDRAMEQELQVEAAKLVKEFVQKYLDKGYSNTSDEVLDLLNRGYGYSDDLMNEFVDALEGLTSATDAANQLAEKQQEVEKARQELENTKKQRTVRIYNPVTGQWEWVAKADDILKAQENLAKAEKDYQDTKIEQELEAIKNGNIGDIGDLTMSPALREIISKASDEEQKRITDILHAISGGAQNTADTTGESIFRSTDSHDVYYQFGDLKLSETEAKNMTVKELADQLKTLKLT